MYRHKLSQHSYFVTQVFSDICAITIFICGFQHQHMGHTHELHGNLLRQTGAKLIQMLALQCNFHLVVLECNQFALQIQVSTEYTKFVSPCPRGAAILWAHPCQQIPHGYKYKYKLKYKYKSGMLLWGPRGSEMVWGPHPCWAPQRDAGPALSAEGILLLATIIIDH